MNLFRKEKFKSKGVVEMKKLISIILILILVIIISIVFIFSCAKREPEVYKIGAILPLTGPAAQYGQWMKQGMDLALDEINVNGITGKKMEIIYEDSKANPKDGVTAMNKLVNIDKVPVVITTLTGVTMSILPMTNTSNTLILTNATHPEVTQKSDFALRISVTSREEAEALANFTMDKLEIKKVALLYAYDEGTIAFKNAFREYYEKLNGKIVVEESYEKDASDFKTQITKIKGLNPQALVIGGFKEVGLIVKRSRELGFEGIILSGSTFESPAVLSVAGTAAEGVIYSISSFDPNSPSRIVSEYQTKYKEKYGTISEIFAAEFYDAVKLVAFSIEKAEYDAEEIRNTLFKVKDYVGVSGKITYLPTGDVKKPIAIKTVKNGQFVSYEKN